LIASLALNAGPACGQERALTDAQWSADLHELVDLIRTEHPRPFRQVDEGTWLDSVSSLDARLPDLLDKEIVVEFARLVALIQDGHTRLEFPRQHEELAFSFSHSSPRSPAFESLRFSALPLRFQVFGNAVYITHTTPALSHLVGAEVLQVGETPAAEAMQVISRVNYNDNDMTDRLLSADRLALPEVLAALGLIADPATVRLVVRADGATEPQKVEISPAADGVVSLVGNARHAALPGFRDTRTPKWSEQLPDRRAHFIKLNEIYSDDEYLLVDFMREEFERAQRAGAERVILDIRHNHGGSAGYNLGIVQALMRSDYDVYGRFFVLIGRETFSAAQMLLNELEQYSDALFVGERSGSNPDHFGDPRRVQLTHSGLTLRVSRLHWSSWRPFDDRTGTPPHIPAAPTIDDYMSWRDAALEAALAFEPPESLAGLIAFTFAVNENWHAGNIMHLRWLTDPRIRDRDISGLGRDLVRFGGDYERQGELSGALLTYIVGLRFAPDERDGYVGLGRTAEAMGEIDEARRAYERGLEAFPHDEEMREKLVSLGEDQRP
jgi:tetratricopeptide (TPR) repeat protein